jgi:hypothetical protein
VYRIGKHILPPEREKSTYWPLQFGGKKHKTGNKKKSENLIEKGRNRKDIGKI